ncbi:MAG: hypothetical protein IKY26_05960 [Erysipelotrichaceae bacterium]|nr:hypothetical protein [Erysipelotrichaceae bacterium]
MEELIEIINVCIYRLNHIKQVLKDEGKEIEKNSLLTITVRHFVNEIYKHIIHYSQPFIKNNHG